ncbi:MAG TPA: alpha/beta hydrolase [Acidimicrobiia bacterium]
MAELITDDSVRVVYDVFDDDADSITPNRPAVLLHHGFGADANINWVRPGVLDALIDDGRVVVTLDARGHGRSDKPADATRYGPVRMARDVSQLADHLGLDGYDMVGYSMGAIVAATAATEDRRVRRLVLGGIGGTSVDPELRAARRESMSSLAEQLEAGNDTAMAQAAGGLFRTLASGDTQAHAALAAAAQAHGDADVVDGGAIVAPTLVLVGEADVLAEHPEVLAAAIPGATLVIVPGDHLGALARPELRRALVDFLHD